MPVKIVGGPTDFKNDQVNREALIGSIDDFLDNVELQTSPSRSGGAVIKTYSCYFPKEQLLQILQTADAGGGLRFHFSVAMEGQQSCETGEPYVNKLVITALATDSEGEDKNAVDDLALMPGVKNANKGKEGCCGGLAPPPYK